jgi:hypothetical protein
VEETIEYVEPTIGESKSTWAGQPCIPDVPTNRTRKSFRITVLRQK